MSWGDNRLSLINFLENSIFNTRSWSSLSLIIHTHPNQILHIQLTYDTNLIVHHVISTTKHLITPISVMIHNNLSYNYINNITNNHIHDQSIQTFINGINLYMHKHDDSSMFSVTKSHIQTQPIINFQIPNTTKNHQKQNHKTLMRVKTSLIYPIIQYTHIEIPFSPLP